MRQPGIVRGQKVIEAKVTIAKELRRKMTKEEEILWGQLRNNQLAGFHFRRQQLIDGFIADFYCRAAKLIVEVDGGIHQQQAGYDAERDLILAGRDLRVVRIKNEDVQQNLPAVLRQIAEICREAQI